MPASCDRNYCTNGTMLDPGLPGDWETKTLECGCEVLVCPADLRYFRHEGQPGMGCYLDPCKVEQTPEEEFIETWCGLKKEPHPPLYDTREEQELDDEIHGTGDFS